MQVDVALEDDGTREPYASRYNQVASTLLREGVDGLSEGFGAECDASGITSKVEDRYFRIRDDRGLDLRHAERQIL